MALSFHCADVGVVCRTVTTADTAEELLGKVSEHAQDAHGVVLNETLIAYALTRVRTGDAEDATGSRAAG